MKSKIFIGMFRPKFEDLVQKFGDNKSYVDYYECKVCGRISYYGSVKQRLHECWMENHFDEPVYKEVDS